MKYLEKNKTYTIKKLSYSRTFHFKEEDSFESVLLFVEPNSNVNITIVDYPNEYDVNVCVEKFNKDNIKTSSFCGSVFKKDLVELI